MNLKQAYINAVNTPSDISEHLPLFNILAKTCKHVTEFGVRWGTSSTAWLNNDVVLRAYDIVEFPEAAALFQMAATEGKDAKLIINNTNNLETIEETDLLFIDSLHTKQQILNELRFANYVKKYIIFHDTVTFGDVGEDGGPGVMHAVVEFLSSSTDWVVLENRPNCNGIIVLTRKELL